MELTRSAHRAMVEGKIQKFHITVQNRSLEVQRISGRTPSAPDLVFLHEGLGSVSHWKEFPARVGGTTGGCVMVYSRYGAGNSEGLTERSIVRYMHDEGLTALPDLLSQLQIKNPI